MLERVTGVPIVAVLFVGATLAWAAETTTAPTTSPPAPELPAQVRELSGKLVVIWYDVDLFGARKPSPLHTAYLTMVLRRAGAAVPGAHDLEDPFNAKARK